MKRIVTVGDRFGRLVVLSRSTFINANVIYTILWNVRCDCGTEKIVRGSHLLTGKTKSCGCLHRERLLKSLVGQRFGRLIVLSKAETVQKTDTSLWNARCDCGTELVVRGRNLRSGNTQSCGCLNKERTKLRFMKQRAATLVEAAD